MSKRKTATPVDAKRVREAYANGEFDAPVEALPGLIGGSLGRDKDGNRIHIPSETGLVRGRLGKAAIEAFNAGVKGEVYAGENTGGTTATVTLPLTKPNARGAMLKRPEDVPVSEVRRLAGTEGKKGRVSSAEVAAAAQAVMAERGWLPKA